MRAYGPENMRPVLQKDNALLSIQLLQYFILAGKCDFDKSTQLIL